MRIVAVASSFAVATAFLGLAPPAAAQMGGATGSVVPYPLSTGYLDNPTGQIVVPFRHDLEVEGATWIRIVFAGAHLAEGSRVRMISHLDGEMQELDARQLGEWQNSSAFFNGSAVRIELVAAPQSSGNYLTIEQVVAGEAAPPGLETICGPADDRVPPPGNALKYVARLLAGDGGWCTGFLYAGIVEVAMTPTLVFGDCMMSAGHCFSVNAGNAVSPGVVVAQFDVPASGPNCTLAHPPVSKQFAIGPVAGMDDNGPGNDWAVFRVYRNTVTGLDPYQTQCNPLVPNCFPPPVLASTVFALFPAGGDASVPGYGSDGGAAGAECNCQPGNADAPRNAVLQEEVIVRPFAVGGTTPRPTIDHVSDTCPGSSGSPILMPDVTVPGFGVVRPLVGIHTHGGCDNVPNASNSGTATNHPVMLPLAEACLTTIAGGAPLPAACPADPLYFEVSLPLAYASITGAVGEVVLWPPVGGTECGGCVAAGVNKTDDDESAAIAMPFPFTYFNAAVANFRVNSNGFVNLGAAACLGVFANQPVATAGAAGKVAPFWDDLAHVPANARTSYLVAGVPGARQLVVQWEELSPWAAACADTGDRISFQAVFDEATHNIEFRYGAQTIPVGGPNYSASIGITKAGAGAPLGFAPSGWNGPSSYRKSPLAPGYTTIVGNPGAVLVLGAGVDDAMSGAINLPAPFSFYGLPKTAYKVSANGFLTFDTNLGGGFFNNVAIPNAAAPNDLVAAFWDDLHTGAAGAVWREDLADGTVVVEWSGVEHFPGDASGESATFQVRLSPSPYDVRLRYDTLNFVGGNPGDDPFTATIGVEDSTGTIGPDAVGAGANAAFPGPGFLLSAPVQSGWNAYRPATNYLFVPCKPCGVAAPFGPQCNGLALGTAGGAPVSPNPAFQAVISGAAPGSIAFLAIGGSNTLLGGAIPLPFPLAGFGFLGGCHVLVDLGILLGPSVVGAGGTATYPLQIPPGIADCAGPLYLQGFNFVPLNTLNSSNALRVRIG